MSGNGKVGGKILRGDKAARKVLYLADGLCNGGAERQLALLIKYLPAEWEPRVWSLGGGPFAAEIRKLGVPLDICARRWRWDFTPALHLWRIIAQWKPDIIHTYGYMSTLAAVLPSRTREIPLVDGTIRQGNVPKRRGRIWCWSLRWADRVIANSRAGLIAFGISPERGRVVHNGFDPARWSLCVRQRNQGETKFIAVMVGRMDSMKDYASFLEAARELANGHDAAAVQFWAIGSGPERKTLLERAAPMIQSGVVRFPEPRMEVLSYICQAHVGILMTTPGVHEGCSNAIIEYMACGLPVICSDSGGNRELVLEGQTGFIIPPGSVTDLIEKLRWLQQHPTEAAQMGEAGRQRIREEFTVERLVRNTVCVYEELL